MSSNLRAELRRPWSLRGRLIAQVLALLALVCLVIGVVTEFALRDFLLERVDRQLTTIDNRLPPPLEGGPPGPRVRFELGQPPDSVLGTVYNGQVVEAKILTNGSAIQLSPADAATFTGLTSPRRPVTITIGDLGEYRMQAGMGPAGEIRFQALSLADVNDTLWRLGWIFGGVALGGLVLAGGIAALTVRRTLRPLDRVAATAAEVSRLPLDRGEPALPMRVSEVDTDTRTEVGKVGAALNRMLDHVSAALAARQRSESRVRQFVADASHELRTPLASIRGYAELTRRSTADLPEDFVYAMSRVESESTRMTTLVEELLLLARLDEGRPVVHAPVELSGLVADAVADAHVAGPDHRWLLDLPAEPISVVGESGQLQQVVLNLLSNARAHTPPGTTVRTSLSTKDGEVRLVVADDGPGIPRDVLPEVFERFARGDTSRSRAAGSTGLGLAIVAAVIAAHGGKVWVRSKPGRTEFCVVLPVTTPP
ncbi:cell wall metabolism sensor histidine kinase WalK [Amycolatopsis sp. 195334CR]|uniref:sensor histidine kinase n=1 Tax=Amycolatopsis sp. 195334CR TaxID=2814588 RepID=UPI001A8CFAEF|nr:HAMP domain-containing sensor histidine kinase [Amycolatopsis sp. 195334CR]MBN6035207.1 HAMP domain-containing histidine kinase [Amycolatopsis sp. 195334CR]